MKNFPQFKKWLPVLWICFAAAILWADYSTDADVAFSYLFLIPVALAARYNGKSWGIFFAISLPFIRLAWIDLWILPYDIFNACIRAMMLTIAAFLINRVTRLSLEVRVLKGLLPICSFCKKVRDSDQTWHPIDSYITQHSEARFTHTFCPHCQQKHYAQYIDQDEFHVTDQNSKLNPH